MNTQDFDENFSRKLRNLELKPRPQAFDRLSAQIAKPNKKPIAVWWMVSGVGLAASVVLFLTIVKPEIQTMVNSVTLATIQPKKSETQVQNESNVIEKQKKKIETPGNHPLEEISKEKRKVTEIKAPEKQNVTSVKTLENQNLTNQTEKLVMIAKTDLPDKNTALISIKPIGIEKEIELPKLKFVVLTESESEKISESNPQKKTKAGRFVQQLGNLKQGKKADFKEFGLDKHALIATLKEKFN